MEGKLSVSSLTGLLVRATSPKSLILLQWHWGKLDPFASQAWCRPFSFIHAMCTYTHTYTQCQLLTTAMLLSMLLCKHWQRKSRTEHFESPIFAIHLMTLWVWENSFFFSFFHFLMADHFNVMFSYKYPNCSLCNQSNSHATFVASVWRPMLQKFTAFATNTVLLASATKAIYITTQKHGPI